MENSEVLTRWRHSPAAQQPQWPDPVLLREVLIRLSAAPGLVSPPACDDLRSRLAAVAAGEALVLQGGDCAETFNRTTPLTVQNKARTLLQMAAVLTQPTAMPVVTIGRMAGQYAKPRSSPTETRGGVTLPTYRGDAVNGFDFDPVARVPDPARLGRMYEASRSTLDIVSGYAQPDGQRAAEIFASHEGLLLDYEDALTRTDPVTERDYATSGHMLWIGERTRALDGAHVAYFRDIANPVGVKLGPTTTPAEVQSYVNILDPDREPGRLTFITRMGARQIRDRLPALIRAVRDVAGRPVWICDPMHGNTFATPSGHKTRMFADIVDEVRGFFEVHRALGTHPGGVHVELTGEDVTECIGGSTTTVLAGHLPHRYESACDPRLNRGQSLDLALHVAELL